MKEKSQLARHDGALPDRRAVVALWTSLLFLLPPTAEAGSGLWFRNACSAFARLLPGMRRTTAAVRPAADLSRVRIHNDSLKESGLVVSDLVDADGNLYLFRVTAGRTKPGTSGLWAQVNGFTSLSLSPDIAKSWRLQAPEVFVEIYRINLRDSPLYYSSPTGTVQFELPTEKYARLDGTTPLSAMSTWDEVVLPLGEAPAPVAAIPLARYETLLKNHTVSIEPSSDPLVKQGVLPPPRIFNYQEFLLTALGKP